jgi:hypothetical protein
MSLLFLLVIAFLLVAASPAKAIHRDAIGVLYYMQGGTGSGEICFQTGRRHLCIDYENPYKEYGAKDADRYKYGSIWRVRYHIERFAKEDARIFGEKRHFVLDSITFTGRFDSEVLSANELIYHHYSLLAVGDYAKAYNDLSRGLRAKQSYEAFVEGCRSVKFRASLPEQVGANTFMRFAVPTYATRIVSHTGNKVVIDVDMSHFVEGEQRIYRFDVIRIDNLRLIDSVRSITRKQSPKP